MDACGYEREKLLNGIYAGTPFKTVVRDLGLTSQQVWGLTKTDQGRSTALEAALTAARRGDLEHGTNAAYANGCVCRGFPGAPAAADGQEPQLVEVLSPGEIHRVRGGKPPR